MIVIAEVSLHLAYISECLSFESPGTKTLGLPATTSAPFSYVL